MTEPTREELIAAVTELRDEIKGLVEELRQPLREVRTRRLVVVDEDGFERIVASTLASSGSVDIYGKGDGDAAVRVSLQASEESALADGGLYISAGPDGFAASLWLQHDPSSGKTVVRTTT